MEAEIVGGCLCGAVRFRATPPVKFCVHCHCNWCRRAHGAAFVTWFGVQDAAFSITSGGDALKWFASSELSDRGFCGTCGSTMFFRSKLAAGEMHVALACAKGSSLPAPTAHIFWEAKAPWITMGDDLPKIDRDHKSIAQYQAIPRTPADRA
jgi:hypothetical protein